MKDYNTELTMPADIKPSNFQDLNPNSLFGKIAQIGIENNNTWTAVAVPYLLKVMSLEEAIEPVKDDGSTAIVLVGFARMAHENNLSKELTRMIKEKEVILFPLKKGDYVIPTLKGIKAQLERNA